MGSPPRTIWTRSPKRQMFLHDTYADKTEAIKVARYYKKKRKNKYVIMKYDSGGLFPHIRYAVYLDKTIGLW